MSMYYFLTLSERSEGRSDRSESRGFLPIVVTTIEIRNALRNGHFLKAFHNLKFISPLADLFIE